MISNPAAALDRTSWCTLVTSGHTASTITALRAAAAVTTPGAEPWADSMIGAPSGTSSMASTNTTPARSNISTTVALCTMSWKQYTGGWNTRTIHVRALMAISTHQAHILVFMPRLPVVAVVGRPNVGKSTLVNRILKRRAAVVQEKPGVTRDRREFNAEWAGVPFVVVDTGGGEASRGGLIADVRGQAGAAVAGADLVLVVTDATTPIGDDDLAVARIVQTSNLPAILIANKADGARAELELAHLWALGLGEPQPISALHGRNIGDLLDTVIGLLPEPTDEPEPEATPTLAILGRPNLGKSTLLNRLAGEQRVVVSPEPGTTRDPVDTVVELEGARDRAVGPGGHRKG